MVKGIDHQTSGSVVVFMTSKLIAEIELGGDESNCFKKASYYGIFSTRLQGFSRLNSEIEV